MKPDPKQQFLAACHTLAEAHGWRNVNWQQVAAACGRSASWVKRMAASTGVDSVAGAQGWPMGDYPAGEGWRNGRWPVEARRERIADCAYLVAQQTGLMSVTRHRVAERAGCSSTGTVTGHYRMPELHQLIIDRAAAEGHAELLAQGRACGIHPTP